MPKANTGVRGSGARKRVVVVGANFAGLTTAMRLSRDYDVTVLDRSPWFEFLPNIHELLSQVKTPQSLRLSRERLLRRAGHKFIQQGVTAIRPAEQLVETETGSSIPYDACVVAIGGVNNTFGVEGADEFAMPFKSVDDCRRIGERLCSLAARNESISVVIVGGGLEGIESLGEILRKYRSRKDLEVHVVESKCRLMAEEPEALDAQIRKACRSLPVHLHMGQRVKAVTRQYVELVSGERIHSNLTIWTGGAAPPKLLTEAGLTTGQGRWAAVEPTLQSVLADNIFVIGDAADLPNPVAKQAYHAMDMGACAAENVRALFSGRAMARFEPSLEIALVAFGDLDTKLILPKKLGGRVISGPSLAGAKEAVFQLSMARMDPPDNATSLFEFQNRAWTSTLNLFLPTFLSPFSLLRLARLRFS